MKLSSLVVLFGAVCLCMVNGEQVPPTSKFIQLVGLCDLPQKECLNIYSTPDEYMMKIVGGNVCDR